MTTDWSNVSACWFSYLFWKIRVKRLWNPLVFQGVILSVNMLTRCLPEAHTSTLGHSLYGCSLKVVTKHGGLSGNVDYFQGFEGADSLPGWHSFISLWHCVPLKIFLKQCLIKYLWLAWNLLCRSGWPETHTEILLPLPPEWVLGLMVCAITCLLLSHLHFQNSRLMDKHVYNLGLCPASNMSLQAIIHHHKAALQSWRRNRDARADFWRALCRDRQRHH